jgi:ABC-type branched-subunit amino acid transport system substrate-binding protein
MPPSSACPRCATPIGPDAVEALCPKCLLVAFLAPEPAPAQSGARIGDHVILEELGRGGMGVVFKARDARLDRIVALKMVSGGGWASEEDKAKFRAEAKRIAMLDHAGIVRILQQGEGDAGPWFTMPLMEGGSLAADLAWFCSDVRRACALVETIARAADHAHRAGVVHRDLKPANVLLDAERKPHLADFGAAKLRDVRGLTQTGVAVGTANYMAPEQARGEKTTGEAADVWGLGAILYELLTGRPPFAAKTYDATLRLVCEAEPTTPRALNPAVEADLETICLKCLEKQPERRYGSALALADDLARFLRGENIQARPIGPALRARRWARRHPLASVIGAGLAFIAVAATLGTVEQERRTRDEVLKTNAKAARMGASAVLSQLQQAVEEFQFRTFSDQIQRPSQDPALVKRLEARDYDGLQQAALPAGAVMPGPSSIFDGWLLLDEDGVARARWPAPARGYLGTSFAQRDFFTGAVDIALAGKRLVHVSRVFQDEAEADGGMRLAFSTPMFGSDGTLTGVLVAVADIGAVLGAVQPGDVLVGPRDMSQADARPYVRLVGGAWADFDASQLPSLGSRADVTELGGQLRPADATRTATVLGPWLRGVAPVGDTGYFVVVQTRDTALLFAPQPQPAPKQPAVTAAGDPILIGEVCSLTGHDAESGIATRNGVELAVLEANAHGGVNGRPLALRVYDDQSTPAGAASMATRLVKTDHVSIIIGEAISASSLAMAPVAQAGQVPMLSPASTNPGVTEVGDFIFRACFTDVFQGRAMARYAREALHVKNVAVLTEQGSAYSEGLGSEFRLGFEATGGRVVLAGSYSKGDTVFREQLLGVRAAGAEALYLPGYVGEVVLIAQQARQLGIAATLLGADAWDSAKLRETGGGWIRDSFITTHVSPDDPKWKELARRYEGVFNMVPDARAALGYDAARVAIAAMTRAGSLSGPALRDALAQTHDFPGVTGPITIDAQRNAVKPLVILEVGERALELVSRVEP